MTEIAGEESGVDASKGLRRFLIAIGAALGVRQMALLLVMPFISLYGRRLEGQTPLLVGMALGIYGLSQAMMQIPFGRWSDRFGRKPMLLARLPWRTVAASCFRSTWRSRRWPPACLASSRPPDGPSGSGWRCS